MKIENQNIQGTFDYLNIVKEQTFQNNASFSEYLQKNSKFDEIDATLKNAKEAITNIGKSFENDLENFNTGEFDAKLELMRTALKEANIDEEKQNILDFSKLEQQSKSDSQMFKTFDFMQIMNKLMYGNNDEKEQQSLLNKAMKIAKEI